MSWAFSATAMSAGTISSSLQRRKWVSALGEQGFLTFLGMVHHLIQICNHHAGRSTRWCEESEEISSGEKLLSPQTQIDVYNVCESAAGEESQLEMNRLFGNWYIGNEGSRPTAKRKR